MALTITVTKGVVVQTQLSAFSITMNLICMDGAIEAINQDFSILYKQGMTMVKAKAKMIEPMQAAIDAYKAAKAVSNSAALGTVVSEIQAALVG